MRCCRRLPHLQPRLDLAHDWRPRQQLRRLALIPQQRRLGALHIHAGKAVCVALRLPLGCQRLPAHVQMLRSLLCDRPLQSLQD